MKIGYKLTAEAFGPRELIRQAVLAEQAGFEFVEMSDHYHPWLEAQATAPAARGRPRLRPARRAAGDRGGGQRAGIYRLLRPRARSPAKGPDPSLIRTICSPSPSRAFV
jgi:hypothetical protein